MRNLNLEDIYGVIQCNDPRSHIFHNDFRFKFFLKATNEEVLWQEISLLCSPSGEIPVLYKETGETKVTTFIGNQAKNSNGNGK